MAYAFILYCDHCMEKCLSKERLTIIYCEKCTRLGWGGTSANQQLVPMQHALPASSIAPSLPVLPKQKEQRTPVEGWHKPKAEPIKMMSAKVKVVAETQVHFVRWLVKNRLSRKDFEFAEYYFDARGVELVVLDGADKRPDWPRTNGSQSMQAGSGLRNSSQRQG